MSLDEFFEGFVESRQIFDDLHTLVASIGPVELKISKSQIVFARTRPFAWVWIPGRYLHGRVAPLVLSLAYSRRDPSPRWKEIVEPYPKRFMHHLELNAREDVDDEVRDWLKLAWDAAL